MGKAGTLAPAFHLMELSLSDPSSAGKGGMSALLLAAHLLMIETQWAPNQVLDGHGSLLPQLETESSTGRIFLVRQQRHC